MADSVDGWTMPDWSIYDTEQLENLRDRHQDAITRHQESAAAVDSVGYWRAMVKSINTELEFRTLVK